MTNFTAEQLLSGVPVDIADDPWVKSAIDLIRERESAPVVPVAELESLAFSLDIHVRKFADGGTFEVGKSHAYADAAASIRQLIAQHEDKAKP